MTPGAVRYADWFAAVRADYEPVRVLSRKPEGESLLLRHKTLGKKLVLRRFSEEKPVCRLLQTVSHPNLPLIYDTAALSDAFVALEEYIEGVTVAEVLEMGAYTFRGAGGRRRVRDPLSPDRRRPGRRRVHGVF